MVRKVVSLSAQATVAEACEFFIQHRLLAFPVVDEQNHVLGVVDMQLYTDELNQLGDAEVKLFNEALADVLEDASKGSGLMWDFGRTLIKQAVRS